MCIYIIYIRIYIYIDVHPVFCPMIPNLQAGVAPDAFSTVPYFGPAGPPTRSSLLKYTYSWLRVPSLRVISHPYPNGFAWCWWFVLGWNPDSCFHRCLKVFIIGWWFGPFFIFHNIWDNPSHWLIFFKMVKATNQYIIGSLERVLVREWIKQKDALMNGCLGGRLIGCLGSKHSTQI